MANPQPDQFTKLSNELFEAIMKTDFSKRQRNILDLVIRMSYGCRKKSAILRPSDFEVVGILRGHVKKELEYLQMANVLHINGEIYTLNKDYDSWRVSIAKTFNEDKYHKILLRNVAQSVTESGTKVTETVTNFEDDENEELPKQEQGCYQNSNTFVTKTVTGTAHEPSQDAASQSPKDIKESKDIKTSTSSKVLRLYDEAEPSSSRDQDYSFGHIYKIFEDHFTDDGRVTELEREDLIDQFETYGGEWLLEAMREAVRAKVKTLAYINGVLNGFKKRGGTNKDKPANGQQNTQSGPPLDDDDPITRMMREEDARALGAASGS
ncbi:replication protein [Cohnella sp. GCM10012308]|uniref:replication protein n=1 Tax=Cohnella sp. GCM10012308 TaxID=3317329 RepID=UPI00361085F7